MSRTWPLVAALMLAACDRDPEPPIATRPDWRGGTIDGIAPLMSPQVVAAALARHGYVQVPCPGRTTPKRALYEGSERPCYRSPTRPMTAVLYFMELNEGRRLGAVNFHQFELNGASDAERLAAGGALARRLRTRLGRPSTAVDQSPDYRIFYWNRPGRRPDQPDTISTTVGPNFAPGITMTSMWAYGEVRSEP